jgi:hypothetical protein
MNKNICEVLVRKKEIKKIEEFQDPTHPQGCGIAKLLHVAHEIFAYSIAIKSCYDNWIILAAVFYCSWYVLQKTQDMLYQTN